MNQRNPFNTSAPIRGDILWFWGEDRGLIQAIVVDISPTKGALYEMEYLSMLEEGLPARHLMVSRPSDFPIVGHLGGEGIQAILDSKERTK